ncbi:MAG: phosphatase PAP2 family protein [Ferruginibacter sp.]
MTNCAKFIYLFILLFPTITSAQDFDSRLAMSINKKQSAFKTNYFSLHANTVTYINIAAPAVILSVGILRHDKKLQRDAAYMVGGFLLSTAVTHAGKKLVKKIRPCDKYPEITKYSSGGGYSFPSGHTSAAFNTATSLCLRYPKWYVIAPACIWASSVSFARIYQGVHYPTDILAGALVGAGSAYISYKLQRWIEKKHAR